MKRVKTAVLVSGGGTNLQALIDEWQAGKMPCVEFVSVIASRPDAYALVRAEKAGIPAHTVPRRGGTQEAFEAEILRLLEKDGVQLIVLAGFMSILSADFVRRYPRRILNVHPALLPAFGGKGFYGLHVHEAALARGVRVTGATVHYVNEIADGGEILLQKAVDVLPGDTPETLQRRVMEQAEWLLLPRAAEMAAERIANE
ncbi:MAG: phosphoribosylglycinamide formyltransferase [Clostridiales bacterium]|nr:phosphoribosylglycinamide formyltransferase [Clostridiales bacterium]